MFPATMETNSTNTTYLLSVEYYYYTERTVSVSSIELSEQSLQTSLYYNNGSISLKGAIDNSKFASNSEWARYDWNGSQYPSGYSQIRIILTAFFVTFIMVVIVVGNMLVCIAIATEKTLKTVQNWFIASLAVSDFLVGLVIMPFSLAKELMGYWIFGTPWCEIHAALDVLLCTASINNLCLISLDRYWSVTQAVEYLKKRTPTRAVLMICFVWILSALISLPPLLGWKKEEKHEDYPSCSLSDDVGYVLYSALGSFYIPAVVMVFVYIRIFMAARSRARRHVKKSRQPSEVTNDPPRDKSTTTTTCTSFSNPSPPDKRYDSEIFRFQDHSKANGRRRERSPNPIASTMPHIIIEASREKPTIFPSETSDATNGDLEDIEDEDEEDQNRPNESDDKDDATKHAIFPLTISSASNNGSDCRLDETPVVLRYYHQPVRQLPMKSAIVKRPNIFVSENVVASQRSDSMDRTNSMQDKPVLSLSTLTGRPLTSDAEKHKRRIAKARERRATLILGLIMAAFILAWLPFFVLYVLEALCSSCNIGPTGFATAFWLGYCNSALNPIIYTIFNRDFRRAFKKILLK